MRCFINGCKSNFHLSVKQGGVSSHRFPNSDEKAKLWCEAVADFSPGFDKISISNARICAAHFLPSDYCFQAGIRRLRPGAVPTVFDGAVLQQGVTKLKPKPFQELQNTGLRTEDLRFPGKTPSSSTSNPTGPQLSHALRMLLVQKLSEHREEYAQDQLVMWKRIAAELSSAPEADGAVFCHHQLSLYFKKNLVCNLKELRLTTDQDLIDRLQFPYLRKVYDVIIKFVERHTAKQNNEEKQQNRLFIKYMFNGVQYDPAVVAVFKSRSKKRTRSVVVFINVTDPEYQLRPEYQKLLLQMTKTGKAVQNRPVKGTGVVQPEQIVSTPIVLDGVSVPIDASSPGGRSVGDLLETETLSFNTQQYNDLISESLEPGLAPAAPAPAPFDPDEVICIDDSDSSESESESLTISHSVISAVKAEIASKEGRKLIISTGSAQTVPENDAHFFSDQSDWESDQVEDSVVQPPEMVLLNGSKTINSTSDLVTIAHDPFQTSDNASPSSAGQSAALQMNAITSSSEKSSASNAQHTPLCVKKAATIRKLAFDETGTEGANPSENGLDLAPLVVPPPVAAEVVPENVCSSQSEENVDSEPLFTPSSGECANNEKQQSPLQNLSTVNEGAIGLQENPVAAAAAASCHRNEDAEMAEDQPQSSQQIDQAETSEPTPVNMRRATQCPTSGSHIDQINEAVLSITHHANQIAVIVALNCSKNPQQESSFDVPAAIAPSTKATAQTQTSVPWSERQRLIEPTIARHSLVREVLQHRWPELFSRDPSRFGAIWEFTGILNSLMFPKLRPTDGERVLGLVNMVSSIAVSIAYGATDGHGPSLPDNSASLGEAAAAQSRRRKPDQTAEDEEAEHLRLVKKRKVDAAQLRKQNSLPKTSEN